MLEDLHIRHYSPTTIRLYLYAVRAFAKYFGKPPDQLGAEHIRRYQLFLTKEKKVSTSTYVMMICGLRFFYTHTLHRKVAIDRIPFPRRERKLPMILNRDEVKALLEAPRDLRHRAMLAILYGSGLRVSEVTRLKVADIDSDRNVLWVRFGKGRKDRQALWFLKIGTMSTINGRLGGAPYPMSGGRPRKRLHQPLYESPTIHSEQSSVDETALGETDQTQRRDTR
jgi:site-specific recombinase XerD